MRETGFFFSVRHEKIDGVVRFVLSASCGKCGHCIEPDGQLEMIVPCMLKHSAECFVDDAQ